MPGIKLSVKINKIQTLLVNLCDDTNLFVLPHSCSVLVHIGYVHIMFTRPFYFHHPRSSVLLFGVMHTYVCRPNTITYESLGLESSFLV